MTREEATTVLKEMHDSFDRIHENTNWEIGFEQMTALDIAIEALTNLKEEFESADAEQGEWEDREVFNETDDDHIVEEWQSARCSVCGKYHTTPYMYYFDDFNYCPNCGARMIGGDDE